LPPILTLHEQRVLGCLLEKEKLTPESYPLTLNSLKLACNQKTSREPVLELTEGEVSSALSLLKGKDLIFTRTDARASKYNHTLERIGAFTGAQQAVITLLLLRGPQTPGELRGRSERMHEFKTPAEVDEALQSLANYQGGAWVKKLERRPGEKEARWAHLLGGETTEVSVAEVIEAQQAEQSLELDKRVEDLEREVAALAAVVRRLEARLEKGSAHVDTEA
jgi:uncharacterized protein YceH (UPF0502 family)